LLLFHLAGYKFENQFFVVGDDVVIMDNQLHIDYIDMLDRMSCPWSEDKSISSSKLCEFAGKIITPSRVIPQLKWRGVSDENFLDLCRLLGRKSRSLLTERQKRVFDSVAHLCAPIGLNFSKPGDNLATMVRRTLDFYRPDEEILGYLMGLRKRMNRNVMSSTEPVNGFAVNCVSDTFDEKVKSVLSRTVFSRWESSLSIGLDALGTVPSALGLQPRLPYEEKPPSRVTTLERYERLIGMKP
jgi:hypothetical protein